MCNSQRRTFQNGCRFPTACPDTCEEQDHVVLLGALSGLETVLLVIYYQAF